MVALLIPVVLAVAGVTVPVLGTTIQQTPALGWVRGVGHLVLGGVSFYFGFVRRPAAS